MKETEKVFCPLEEIELSVEKCPVRCMYRCSSGLCAHADLAYDETLTPEKISEILGVPLKDTQIEIQRATQRIRVALVAEAYIGYATKEETVNTINEKQSGIFKILKINPNSLKTILLRSKYEKWREVSKVDVSFETLCLLFQKALTKAVSKGN